MPNLFLQASIWQTMDMLCHQNPSFSEAIDQATEQGLPVYADFDAVLNELHFILRPNAGQMPGFTGSR